MDNKLTVKDSALSFLVGFLICQIGVVAITCVTLIIYSLCRLDIANFSIFLSSVVGYLITSLSMYIIMLGVFFFFNRKKENKLAKNTKVYKFFLYSLIAVASFLMLYPIVTCVDTLLVKIGATINTLSYELSTRNYFISLISLVVAPAVCEELLFRGIIFQGLKRYGKTLAITLSSIMFCIFHMSISQTIYPILMGLLLGVIMYYEENIYYCIAVHLTNNFSSLTLSYFKINLIFQHWTYILLAVILFVAFLSLVLFFAIKGNKASEKQPMIKSDKIVLFVSLGIMILLWILVNLTV